MRYWRFFWFKVRNPHVITRGMVFLGRRVEVYARRGYGQLIIGRWVHVGDENRLRCHEGVLTIGDKCVFGRDNTINCYLDVELGPGTIVADWVYICDFDHVTSDIHVPIKDQGITKTPVRIGADVWLGAKSTVLRGTSIGHGSVVAAHAVARGSFPPLSIVGGIPARILKNRADGYEADAVRRAALIDIARKTALAAADSVARSGHVTEERSKLPAGMSGDTERGRSAKTGRDSMADS